MIWFFLALIGPLMYAITNHVDKILLDKYFKKGGVGTILLLNSLFAVVVLPFLFFADKTVLDVDGTKILALAIVGILNVAVLWFYLLALKDEEASVTVVFYQLVPVFACILGYFVLGEILTRVQLIAMAIIIFGATIISLEIDLENKFKFRRKAILPMIAASFFWALGSVIFKAVAIEENVWRSLFWEHSMLLVVGIGIFIFVRSYRANFLSAIHDNSKTILSISFANELIYILGNLAFAFAYMLAPVALVLLTNSFQSFFVLIIGILLTIFFPKILVEKIQAKYIWPKIIAICITGIGTYLLFVK
jgi:drug/metabolite transporter (DMT)-like permease